MKKYVIATGSILVYCNNIWMDIVIYYSSTKGTHLIYIFILYISMCVIVSLCQREDDPENTFQVILASDARSRKSFVMFKYHDLNWVGSIPNVAGMQV